MPLFPVNSSGAGYQARGFLGISLDTTQYLSEVKNTRLFLSNQVLSFYYNYLLDSILFHLIFEYNGFVLTNCQFKAL